MVRSPKLASDRSSWYPYYAGYSAAFVEDVLRALELGDGDTVLDPWNGSGTTTAVALAEGVDAVGYDANPALVVIGRARLLGVDVAESLDPLADDILDHARAFSGPPAPEGDPLDAWLQGASAYEVRLIERAIQHVLVEHEAHRRLTAPVALEALSALAAFFYVALFDAVRAALRQFVGSNPTWVKAAAPEQRLVITVDELHASFRHSVVAMRERLGKYGPTCEGVSVGLADSQSLPLGDDAVGAVITSPPYCTRIDYIAATRPELAVLGYSADQLRRLRETMVGTPTIAGATPEVAPDWGPTATSLIADISTHRSQASSTYYRKYFVQYFDSLWRSLKEIRRVVTPGGAAVIVVQDSYYKDIHIELSDVVSEMGKILGWPTVAQTDFPIAKTKAAIHPGSRAWRSTFSATESVLTLS